MNKIFNFVPRHVNLPNVPRAESIKNFWGCLAQKVYDGGYEAKNDEHLISRIKSKMKEFDFSYVENLMKVVKEKIKSIGQNGILSFTKNEILFRINTVMLRSEMYNRSDYILDYTKVIVIDYVIVIGNVIGKRMT